MAKRKRSGGRRRGGFAGRASFGDVTKGAMSGAVSQIADQAVGNALPIAGVGDAIAGLVTHDPWVSHLGGYKAGRSLAANVNIGGIFGGAPASGGGQFL